MPSSVIQDFEYEPELARLTISFTTGRVYQYFMVPPEVAASFHAALSKGTYFNTRIRDRFSVREVVAAEH
ncbi:MAG TPA: KTSC domain-containing protein [Pseudolabrys sp.]